MRDSSSSEAQWEELYDPQVIVCPICIGEGERQCPNCGGDGVALA